MVYARMIPKRVEITKEKYFTIDIRKKMEDMFLQYSSGEEKSKNVSQSISIRLGGISYNKCRNKQQIMVYN
jgi:hypothetical protein